MIGGIVQKYHMAVIGSPAAAHRWAYLYTNQKKEVFMDSHVRYFEMMGGVPKEMVYDNMRNVVHRFIGKNEKELNPDLIKMSEYYGFDINVTNCFSGNEKGFVESSVKKLRREIFAKKYEFDKTQRQKKKKQLYSRQDRHWNWQHLRIRSLTSTVSFVSTTIFTQYRIIWSGTKSESKTI